MSYECSVYTTTEPPPRLGQVLDGLLRRGFSGRLVDTSTGRVLRPKTLREGRVLAWSAATPEAAEILAAVKAASGTDLARYYQGNIFTWCDLHVTNPFRLSDTLTPDELRELRAEIGDRHFRGLKRATVRYTTLTVAGRNDLALDLQAALSAAIINEVGGVFEDPQMELYLHRKASAGQSVGTT